MAMCEGCGKVPAACKCRKGLGSPWHQGSIPNMANSTQQSALSEQAEALRQRRAILADKRSRDQATEGKERKQRQRQW